MVLQTLSSPAIQLPIRRLLWATAASQQTSQKPPSKEAPKVQTLSTGEKLVSWENYQPISRVCVAYKAGSRYEDASNVGVTHCLRNAAGFTTEHATIFGIIRNLQLMGANMKCTTTRDFLIYTLECHRDNLPIAVEYFAKAVNGQVFKPWELGDYLPRMKLELASIKQQPNIRVLEAVHKAAFRRGLGNSLYSPSYMLGKHNPEMLSHFVNQNCSPGNTAISCIGMNDITASDVGKMFGAAKNKQMPSSAEASPSKFAGGEIRIETADPYTYVAVAASGVSLAKPKDCLAAGILQHILGTGPHVKRGLPPTKLMQAASKATDKPFVVTALNLNYSDAGLFGFFLAGQPEDMHTLVPGVVEEIKRLKSGVADKEVQVAKERLRATIHMAAESSSNLAEEFCLQALTGNEIYKAPDVDALLSSVTSADVNQVAKKIVEAKPAMAAIGDLHRTPYLDQIK